MYYYKKNLPFFKKKIVKTKWKTAIKAKFLTKDWRGHQ